MTAAVPQITKDLHLPLGRVNAAASLMALAAGMFIIAFGAIADRRGRVRIAQGRGGVCARWP